MLLGDLDIDASPALGALGKVDSKFAATTGSMAKLGAIGGAAFAAVNVAVELVTRGVEMFAETLDLGGTLTDLSLRTGEAVGDLVILREAFTEAGLGADGVEPFLIKLQDNIAGVNEDSASAAGALKALGTSAGALRQMTGIQQIETLQKGFAGLADQTQRVQVARDLLGKSGGAALSLLGDPEVLEDARRRAGNLAVVMEQNAGAFDKLGDVTGSLKLKFQEFFGGALAEAAPAATSLADALASIDFVKFGEGFGIMAKALAEFGQTALGVTQSFNGFLDKVAEFFLGPKAPEISEYNKSGVEFRRKTSLDSVMDGDKSPVAALQKIGRGGYGGGADPMLTEAQRQTSLLQQAVDLLRTPIGTGAQLDVVPV